MMNRRLFNLLHLAPVKPLQTDEAKSPPVHLYKDEAVMEPALVEGGKHSPSAWPAPSQAAFSFPAHTPSPCSVTNLSLGLVLSEPVGKVLTRVVLQQPQSMAAQGQERAAGR